MPRRQTPSCPKTRDLPTRQAPLLFRGFGMPDGGHGVGISRRGGVTKDGKSEDYFAHGWSHKLGRNSPCPYGSGKKFKHCCL